MTARCTFCRSRGPLVESSVMAPVCVECDADVKRKVVESRAAQGLPPKIEDAATLRKIAETIVEAERRRPG